MVSVSSSPYVIVVQLSRSHMTRRISVAQALGHLERDLKKAREQLNYAESQRQARQHVLTQRREDTNALRAENARRAQELENLKAQPATAQVKEWQTNQTFFGNLLYPF